MLYIYKAAISCLFLRNFNIFMSTATLIKTFQSEFSSMHCREPTTMTHQIEPMKTPAILLLIKGNQPAMSH